MKTSSSVVLCNSLPFPLPALVELPVCPSVPVSGLIQLGSSSSEMVWGSFFYFFYLFSGEGRFQMTRDQGCYREGGAGAGGKVRH